MKVTCPLCGTEVEAKEIFLHTSEFRIFGLSLSQIKKRLDFARSKDYAEE